MEKSRLLPLHPLSPPAPPLPLPCTLKGRGHGSGCGSASWGALVALQPLTPCFSSFPWLPRPQGRGPSPPRRSSFNPCSQGPFAKKIVEIPAPKPREVGAGGRSPPVLLPRFGEAAQQGWGTADPTKGPGRTQAGWERAPGIWGGLGETGRDWGGCHRGVPRGDSVPGSWRCSVVSGEPWGRRRRRGVCQGLGGASCARGVSHINKTYIYSVFMGCV